LSWNAGLCLPTVTVLYHRRTGSKTPEMSVKMIDWVLLVGFITGHMCDGIALPADSCVIPWVSGTCHLALQVISNLTTMVPSFSPSVRGWNFLKPSFIHTLGYLASGHCAVSHSVKNKSGELHLFPSSGERMERHLIRWV